MDALTSRIRSAIPTRRQGLAGVAIALPTVLGVAVWPHFIGSSWFFGMWACIFLMLRGDQWWLSVIKFVGVAVLGMTAAVLHPYPLFGGLFLAVVAAAAAWSIRRGFESVYRVIPIVVSLTIVAPEVQFQGRSSAVNIAWIGLMMFSGSLWTMVCWRGILERDRPLVKNEEVTTKTAAAFALVLGVCIGVAGVVILKWWPEHVAGWTMLTLILIIQTDAAETISLGENRITGTLIGLAIALMLSPIANYVLFATAFGTLLFLYAFWWRLFAHRSYRVFVALLTSAVVLLNSPPKHVDVIAMDRLVFTLAGVALAVPAMVMIRILTRNERHAST